MNYDCRYKIVFKQPLKEVFDKLLVISVAIEFERAFTSMAGGVVALKLEGFTDHLFFSDAKLIMVTHLKG